MNFYFFNFIWCAHERKEDVFCRSTVTSSLEDFFKEIFMKIKKNPLVVNVFKRFTHEWRCGWIKMITTGFVYAKVSFASHVGVGQEYLVAIQRCWLFSQKPHTYVAFCFSVHLLMMSEFEIFHSTEMNLSALMNHVEFICVTCFFCVILFSL